MRRENGKNIRGICLNGIGKGEINTFVGKVLVDNIPIPGH